MKLRPYQQDALNAIVKDIRQAGASLVVMPTASGKSHLIAAASTLIQPVLIIQPTRELLEQNRAKLLAIVDPEEVGTYSASFKEKTIKRFTFATIQSVYKKPHLFTHIRLVILDECHGVAVRALGSMYTSFLAEIGNPKVLGFTATPYRLEIGYFRHKNGDLEAATMLKLINRMRNKNHREVFWKKIIYTVPHRTLLEQGFLSPLEYIDEPLLPYAEIPVNQSYSDYNLEAYAQAVVGREAQIISTIAEAQRRFRSVLVFCSTTEQARELSQVIKGSKMVLATTPAKERASTVSEFKSLAIKTVFNMGTLTTGFDHPELDCIILLRPTRSLPLYNQILGRLTRIAPGKTKGTVIDLTGTCQAIGKIETFEMFQNQKGLWDLRTEKHDSWHDRVLFSRIIEK